MTQVLILTGVVLKHLLGKARAPTVAENVNLHVAFHVDPQQIVFVKLARNVVAQFVGYYAKSLWPFPNLCGFFAEKW